MPEKIGSSALKSTGISSVKVPPSSKKYDFFTVSDLVEVRKSSPEKFSETIKKATIDSIVVAAAASVQTVPNEPFTKQQYLDFMDMTGLKTFLGPAANSYFSYLSKHVWKGKQFIKEVGKEKYVVPADVFSTIVKIPKLTAKKELTFIGTTTVKKTVAGTKQLSSKDLVQQGLKHNDQALLYASAAQIAGEIYGILDKSDNPEVRKQLNELTSKPVTDETLGTLQILQFQVAQYGPPAKYLMPKSWVEDSLDNTVEMYDIIKQVTGEDVGKAKVIALQTEFESHPGPPKSQYYIVPQPLFSKWNVEYAGVGVKGGTGGFINKAHQFLVNLQKTQTGNIKLSQRVVVTEPKLESNKRIQAFMKQWKLNGAERIIDQTTGVTNAGVIFSAMKNTIEGQIQVGEVNAHSIVLHDDGKHLQLKYHDASTSRASLLKEVFEKAGFTAQLSGGHDVLASAKSRPRVYQLLANIVPNTVDLDLGSVAFKGGNLRQLTIQAMLKGYPISGDIREYTMNIGDGKKLTTVFKKASKIIRLPEYSRTDYQSKLLTLTGGAKAQKEALKEKIKIEKELKGKFGVGTIAYVIGGSKGHKGEQGVVTKVDGGMVYLKSNETGEIYDKYPQNVSLTPPIGTPKSVIEKPVSLSEKESSLETKLPLTTKYAVTISPESKLQLKMGKFTAKNKTIGTTFQKVVQHKVIDILWSEPGLGVNDVYQKLPVVITQADFYAAIETLKENGVIQSTAPEVEYKEISLIGIPVKLSVGDKVKVTKQYQAWFNNHNLTDEFIEAGATLTPFGFIINNPKAIAFLKNHAFQIEPAIVSDITQDQVPKILKGLPATLTLPQKVKLGFFKKENFKTLLQKGATYDFDEKIFTLQKKEAVDFLNTLGFDIKVEESKSVKVTVAGSFSVGDYVTIIDDEFKVEAAGLPKSFAGKTVTIESIQKGLFTGKEQFTAKVDQGFFVPVKYLFKPGTQTSKGNFSLKNVKKDDIVTFMVPQPSGPAQKVSGMVKTVNMIDDTLFVQTLEHFTIHGPIGDLKIKPGEDFEVKIEDIIGVIKPTNIGVSTKQKFTDEDIQNEILKILQQTGKFAEGGIHIFGITDLVNKNLGTSAGTGTIMFNINQLMKEGTVYSPTTDVYKATAFPTKTQTVNDVKKALDEL